MIYFWVFVGGGLGSMARFALGRFIQSGFSNINPLATMASNMISTFILGILLYVVTIKPGFPHHIKAMLVVGFCGGFSTFSTFSFETFELMRMGHFIFALLNILISVVFGLAVLYILTKVL
jgi:CrcB protein